MSTKAAAPRDKPHSVRKALRPASLRGRSLLCCLAALLACLAGVACGQRGPLYLPAQEPSASAAPAEPGSADPAADEADELRDENEEGTSLD